MTVPASSGDNIERAQSAIALFLYRFGESYRALLHYAACPPVLTPGLLSTVRQTFVGDKVPWLAEVDLLLSELCHQTAAECFEWIPAVRTLLLREARAALGPEQLRRAAEQISIHIKSGEHQGLPFNAQIQHLALSLLMERQAATAMRQLALDLRESIAPGQGGVARPQGIDWGRSAWIARLLINLSAHLDEYSEARAFAASVISLASAAEAERPRLVRSSAEYRQAVVVLDVRLPELGSLFSGASGGASDPGPRGRPISYGGQHAAPIHTRSTATPLPALSQTATERVVSIKALLEAGAHFGHQTNRWNPKMRPYIFVARNGIHIIDLQKTITGLAAAYEFVADLTARGGKILFVGTKKQAQEAVVEEAQRAGQYYITQRWLGGTLTNFTTIKSRLKRLAELEAQRDRGDFTKLTKAEGLKLEEEIAKLNKVFGGIKTMDRLPSALFIIDPHKEELAVKEAASVGIPVVAMVDTNCDPDPISYVIPCNDDAIRNIRLMTSKIADAAVEGYSGRKVVTEFAGTRSH